LMKSGGLNLPSQAKKAIIVQHQFFFLFYFFVLFFLKKSKCTTVAMLSNETSPRIIWFWKRIRKHHTTCSNSLIYSLRDGNVHVARYGR
jgi:hypothetical protein